MVREALTVLGLAVVVSGTLGALIECDRVGLRQRPGG